MMLRTVGANSATQKTPCYHILSELTDTWVSSSICLSLTAVSKNDGMQSNKHTNLHAKIFKICCAYAIMLLQM